MEAVGSIQTYSGYPSTSQAFTLPPQTTQTPTPITSTSTTQVTPSIAPESMLPRASGTISDCLTYRNAVDLSQETASNVTSNDCSYVADLYAVTISNLTTWNPSLDPDACTLQNGSSYCVQQTNTTYSKLSQDLLDACLHIRTSTNRLVAQPTFSQSAILCDNAYGDIVNGTDASCACFFNVYSYDNDSKYQSVAI